MSLGGPFGIHAGTPCAAESRCTVQFCLACFVQQVPGRPWLRALLALSCYLVQLSACSCHLAWSLLFVSRTMLVGDEGPPWGYGTTLNIRLLHVSSPSMYFDFQSLSLSRASVCVSCCWLAHWTPLCLLYAQHIVSSRARYTD